MYPQVQRNKFKHPLLIGIIPGAIFYKTKAKKSPKVEVEPTLSVTATKGDFHG